MFSAIDIVILRLTKYIISDNVSNFNASLNKLIDSDKIKKQEFKYNYNKLLCNKFILSYEIKGGYIKFYVDGTYAFQLIKDANINEVILKTLMNRNLLILDENERFYNEIYKQRETRLVKIIGILIYSIALMLITITILIILLFK